LEHLNRDGTVEDLFKEFIKQRLASEASLKAQMIDIRFVYQKELVVRKFGPAIVGVKINSNFGPLA